MRAFPFYLRYVLGTMLLASLCVVLPARAQKNLLSDSSLTAFSVEDLVKIRKVLSAERERLIRRQEKIRDRGVEVTEEFLDQTREENSNQDKILIRVAEYYIEEAELDFERRFEEYERQYDLFERQLEAFQRGELKVEPREPEQPQRNYQQAISIYDLIIANFPESDLVDDAYYNKAFLLSEMEEETAARQIFQKIIDEYPESQYAPEAYMMMAESFFFPSITDNKQETILKLNKAIQLYKNVLQYKDSPRYDEALYKLGWSYYRLAGENPDYYTDAIVYFLAVVKDIERLQGLDGTGRLVRTDVKPEALQFIAASFIDPSYKKSGVPALRGFLERLDIPSYGIDILENMGDRYGKITQWEDAINAYSTLLSMYPDYRFAPRVQKKIADAYIADEKYAQAFAERAKLFENYNPRSEWYAVVEQSNFDDRITALDEAYRITEEAFRTNITYLYKVAQEKEADNLPVTEEYQEFAQLCRQYLDNYPTDPNAYEINWAMAYVLDTRLSRFGEAFSEYIKVSNDYLESGHQFDAAVNAINAADTLVKLSRAMEDPTLLGGDNLAARQARDLSPEEKMLAEAYDNFIKLFPESSQTPSVLAAAGALYYNHRKYDLAKKYYKTMVTKFPKAQQKSVGLVSLMNSYFFLGQYRDAEIVAKKIVGSADIPEDQLKIAQSRIGESIFKNGEKLEQEGDHLSAAREYRRVFEEAREYVTFVDLALFRGARNFEQASEWLKAIETYDILITNFPDSKQVLPALNNIAADYKEMEDYLNVAKTNERIFEIFPGTPEAENALFNASLFYAKAEAWNEAIAANNLYIKTYPSNPESKDLLFENAKYYLKIGDLGNANRIYKQFARVYPNDPLTVEAFYNRGVYYFENGKLDSAKIEFNMSIQKSNEFARAGRDPNLFFAAEANFKLGQILYDEYKSIQLSYPQSTLRARLDQKRQKLNEVQKAFTSVIGLGSLRSFEAMYRIAEAYEEFANAIANQKLPENLSPDERLVQEDQVFKASVPAYDRAVEEYKNVLINLPVLAEKLDISLTAEPAPETAPAEGDTSVVVQKEVEADSSREVALRWYGRAKEKISLIQYTVAERSSDFIENYLRVENPNTGIRALVFRDQVLRQLVAPQVKTTIDAHLKNIAVARELGLENKYVQESRRKVLLARNILAQEYQSLVWETADLYKQSISVLESLIEQGESARSPEGYDYYDYQDSYVLQLIFFMNQFSKIALNQYNTTLQLAQEHNIINDARITTEQKMFNFGYESGDLLSSLAKIPEEKSKVYLDRFDETQNENFQLGSTFFDDQSFELTGYAQEVFELAYDFSKESQVENIWTQMILARLVEIDPATYLADLPKEEFTVSSDTTWKATTRYSAGWNQQEFSDEGWSRAVEVAIPLDQTYPVFDSLGVSPRAIWAARVVAGNFPAGNSGNPLEMGDPALQDSIPPDSAAIDSLANPAAGSPDQAAGSLAAELSEPDTLTAYFRKHFQLPSKPIEGWIVIAGDQSYQLYINDVYMVGMDSAGFVRAQYLPFSTFSEFVAQGENLISVSVTDMDGIPRHGLRLYLLVKLLPSEFTDLLQNLRKKIEPVEVDPLKLQQSIILNKNRIIE